MAAHPRNFVICNLQSEICNAKDSARRHGRVLRVGGTARRPVTARTAGGGGRPGRQPGCGRGGQLRGADVRRPLGHADGTCRPPVPPSPDRHARVQEVSRGVVAGVCHLPRGDAAGGAAVARRGVPGRHRQRVGRAAGADRGRAAESAHSRRDGPDGVGWCRPEQVPRQDCLGLEETRRLDRDRARARRALPAGPADRRVVGRRPGHRHAVA